jgi:antitoxin ParD1/3/4
MCHTASEVIREGLRLLKEKESLHQQTLVELRREIQVGIDQVDRGQVSRFNEAALDEVQTRGRERL